MSSFCHLSNILLPGLVSGKTFTRKNQARVAFANRSKNNILG